MYHGLHHNQQRGVFTTQLIHTRTKSGQLLSVKLQFFIVIYLSSLNGGNSSLQLLDACIVGGTEIGRILLMYILFFLPLFFGSPACRRLRRGRRLERRSRPNRGGRNRDINAIGVSTRSKNWTNERLAILLLLLIFSLHAVLLLIFRDVNGRRKLSPDN